MTHTPRAGAIALLLALAGLCVAAALAAAPAPTGTPATLGFRVAGHVSPQARIEEVCCGATAASFGSRDLHTLELYPGRSPVWLRIDAPLAGEVLRITSIVDRADLYWRDRATGQWRSARTGDHVGPETRSLAVPEMALPVPADAAPGPVFLRVEQPSLLSLRIVRESMDTLLRRQSYDRGFKLVLLGFVMAIVGYNLVLAAVVRDRVFLFNALTILSLLLVVAYLSGYGVLYLWSARPAIGEQVMNAGMASTNAFGAVFISDFLARGSTRRGALRLLRATVPLAAIGFAAGLPAGYAPGRHALLLVSGITLLLLTVVTVHGALRGDRHARLIAIPFLLGMLPGLVIAAVQRLTPVELGLVPGNALSIFLAAEALLFSLVLASRLRQAEQALGAADLALRRMRRQASARILRAQDSERQRVAQDLHDSVGQQLMLLVGRLKLAVRESEPTGQVPRPLIAELAGEARETLESVRRIARAMHPAMLEHVGWRSAVEALIGEFDRGSGIHVTLRIAPDAPEPGGETGLHLYRIVQESLINVLRHARASRCEVGCERIADEIRLHVEDDGVGAHEPDASVGAVGIGLTSIDQRVRILGGRWRLCPGAMGGTRIEVSVPAAPGDSDPRTQRALDD